MEYNVNPWEGGNSEQKTGFNPLVFLVKNSNIEETKLEDSGTKFSDIYGSVEVLYPTGYEDDGTPIFEDEENWQFAKLDMELPYGAKIKLRERSGIILSFPDMTTYELKTPADLPTEDTSIILLKPSQQEGTLKLLGGSLYNSIKRVVTEGTMEIEMSQAVAGIKGTTFVMEEDGTNSKLKVIEGVVNFAPKNGDESRDIVAGEEVFATKAGLREIKKFDVAAEKLFWEKQFKRNQTSVNKIYLIIGGIIIFAVISLIPLLKKKLK